MIRHDFPQGSQAWHAARLGIPTASNFGRIITPTGKPSASADAYMHELLAERMLGCPLNTESIDFMERGKALESQAVAFYELQRGVDTEAVGFCLADDECAGCSPDRLVGMEGGLEIKCPSPAVHVGYLLSGGISDKYRPQVQGSLWITGRWWWDTLSYHPDLPPALVRAERDPNYITALEEALSAFCGRLEAADKKLGMRRGAVEGSAAIMDGLPAANVRAAPTGSGQFAGMVFGDAGPPQGEG